MQVLQRQVGLWHFSPPYTTNVPRAPPRLLQGLSNVIFTNPQTSLLIAVLGLSAAACREPRSRAWLLSKGPIEETLSDHLLPRFLSNISAFYCVMLCLGIMMIPAQLHTPIMIDNLSVLVVRHSLML